MNKLLYYGLKDDLLWSNEQLNSVLNDHLELLDILGYLANIMFEKKIKDEPYKYYSETLAYKYIYQSLNLNSLLKGTIFKSQIFNYATTLFDISSTYIMQRALLENYLTFYYLYIQPKSKEESRCKWLIFQIAGLNSRQDFTSNYLDYRPKIDKEKKDIEEYTCELINNDYFKGLSADEQKVFLNKREAKVVKWRELFNQSDLKSELFAKLWKLCSNYAHSEYISLIQFKEYNQNSPEFLRIKDLNALCAVILTSVFVTNMRFLYKEIEDNFSLLSTDSINCIKFLDGIGRETLEGNHASLL